MEVVWEDFQDLLTFRKIADVKKKKGQHVDHPANQDQRQHRASGKASHSDPVVGGNCGGGLVSH